MKYLSALININLAILLAVAAIALMFLIRGAADGKHGGVRSADVSARFLETGESYKRTPLPQAAETRRGAARNAAAAKNDSKADDAETVALRSWVTANPAAASYYANPILIRYDIAFLLALGLFLMIATVWMVSNIKWRGGWPRRLLWIFAVLPAVYIVVDLAEDILLWRLLTDRASISPLLVGIAQKLTLVKLWSVGAAMGVAALVAAFAFVDSLLPASKR